MKEASPESDTFGPIPENGNPNESYAHTDNQTKEKQLADL